MGNPPSPVFSNLGVRIGHCDDVNKTSEVFHASKKLLHKMVKET